MKAHFDVLDDIDCSEMLAYVDFCTELNSKGESTQKKVVAHFVAQLDGNVWPTLEEQIAPLPKAEKIRLIKFILDSL